MTHKQLVDKHKGERERKKSGVADIKVFFINEIKKYESKEIIISLFCVIYDCASMMYQTTRSY